jgi:sterol 3beta-glucosyltransferase
LNIFILTLGSRGDVQPYVALGKGLAAAGHTVTLAAGTGFDDLVAQGGLRYAPIDADIFQLLDAARAQGSTGGMSRLSLIKMVMPMMRRVLEQSWEAAQGAQAIIFHPKPLAGYHIAEGLGIPGFMALPVPLYSPTRCFPSPALPVKDLGGFLNRLSHGPVLAAASAPYRRMVNDFRRQVLGLPPVRDEMTLHGQPLLRLYAVSPHVLPPPPDWDPASILTGYWFLDAAPGWQPPDDLLAFLDAGPAPVYVGFGSMAVQDPVRTTRTVLQALERAGQRAVLAAGWGGLRAEDLPESVYMLESAPHDWLFPRMAAVVHHGGAGTLAAGLRAGKPTLVCPFLADQTFWGWRAAGLKVGPEPLPYKRWTVEKLAEAIRLTATDAGMRTRAAALGEKIRSEDGVRRAVEIIQGVLDRWPYERL